MRHPRAWRITMWTSLAATVVLAGGAILTQGLARVWFDQSGWYVGLVDGSFKCGFDKSTAGLGWMKVRWSTPQSITWWEYNTDSTSWNLTFSVWLPAGATFAASTLSALMVYGPRLPGHCPCGYDRSGLPTDAPCPECGHSRAS